MAINIYKIIKFFLGVVFIQILVFSFYGYAATDMPDAIIKFTSSPNPVGSGARALGMGGAFIAVCDDATAASWNPAGLVQLEKPEMSVVYDYHKNRTDNDYEAFPDASCSQSASSSDLNYLSAAYPFVLWKRNMTASINYQHLYDFDDEAVWTYLDTNNLSLAETTIETTIETKGNYSLEGQLWTISPALAVQVTPSLSVGFTLNFWEDGFYDNQWEAKYSKIFNQTILASGEKNINIRTISHKEKFSFSGLNFHLGLLWNINQYLTIGAVFKAPFKADVKYNDNAVDKSYNDQESFPKDKEEQQEEIIKSTNYSDDQTLDMPMSYGLGAALRLSDALSFSLDVYRTHWKDYILQDSSGEKTSPISGVSESKSDVGNTTQVRLGSEYLIIRKKFIVPLRCGFFYDPEPSMDGTDDFWGMSLGTGITWKRFVFDTAFQYRFGNDIKSIINYEDRLQDKELYTVYTSLIYYF